MKSFLENPLLAVAVIVPCGIVLVILESLHSVPGGVGRFPTARAALWFVAVILVAAFAVVVIARFVDLRT